MTENKNCPECGQPLTADACVNPKCDLSESGYRDPFGSLTPDELQSMDASQIVDYTGTIGVAPEEFGSAMPSDVDEIPANGESDVAQTRMVDDDYYKQIQTYFPADSGSKSARGDSARGDSSKADSGSREAGAVSQSVSVRGVRAEYAIEEFVPPVRDIQFPSGTASLAEMQELEEESIDGDEYKIVEKLGEGGYGLVFEAEQLALNRPVAVKVLKPKKKRPGSKAPSRTGTGTGEMQRRRDQFLHEAKITAKLQHPNIVPLYDFGINAQGQLFYTMKKVERRPWSTVIDNPAKLLGIREQDLNEETQRRAISENIEIFSKVCDAMAFSHSRNIIHRDLKPDNIMIGNYGEVLLIDFGMALDLSSDTREFSAGGTLVYMAPEMAVHFAKQKEIQVAAQQTARKLGVEQGSIFLDQSNLVGVGQLAKRLIETAKDQDVIELAESLIRLDAEEKELADKITTASDIYLLGAILYQIAVGHPPHYFPIAACPKGSKEKFQKELWLALKNGFQQYNKITDPLRLSLRNIAVRAMRTDPENRFQTVERLHEAIRGFQEQVQSLELTETGKEELAKASGREDYQHLLPALESFRGAGALWPESNEAQTLQVETACEYANRANRRKDFDAGLSILDEYVLDKQQDSKPVVEVRNNLIRGKKIRKRNRTLSALAGIAAVVLPIAVFVGAVFATAQVRENASLAEAKLESANTKLAEAQPKLEKAEEIEKQLAELEPQLAAVSTQLAEANVAKEEAEKAKELATKATREAQQKLTEASTQLELANTNLTTAEKAAAAAAIAKLNAEKSAKLAQQQAAQFQFDADFGVYNSSVLTLPLDFRANRIGLAADKLKDLLNLGTDEIKPYFQNGWLVKHFAKRARLDANTATGAGENRLGDDVAIRDIETSADGETAVVLGQQSGKPKLWQRKADGSIDSPAIALPDYGSIEDLSLSGDAKNLAIVVDDVPANAQPGSHLQMFSVADAGQSVLPSDSEGVLGSRVVAFSPDGSKLVAVEELSGYRGLKQRVQVSVYSVNEDGLRRIGEEPTPIDATTRDEGRVKYLATAIWNDDRPQVAIAYQTLDADGRDIEQLAVVDGDKVGQPVNLGRFPTRVYLDKNGDLLCGYLDGVITRFNANDLSAPTQRLGDAKKAVQNHESKIVQILPTPDGRVISGSENGIQIVWDSKLQFVKRLEGQSESLSAMALGQSDLKKGILLLSGTASGDLEQRFPETGQGEAIIEKVSEMTVTCGVIDQGLNAGDIPATAYGTRSGEVSYFSPEAMLGRNGGVQVGMAGSADQARATFRFQSPFERFDTAFNDFDSMGIVGDYFVLLKDDGTFYSTFIDDRKSEKTVPSSRVRVLKFSDADEVADDFAPLLASVADKDFFFSSDPGDGQKLLRWNRSGQKFTPASVGTSNDDQGNLKRMALSADGRWLAVVRNLESGDYRAEIYRADSDSSRLTAVTESDTYRVGDPAFVGFSDDSTRMIVHSHKAGVDRETWVFEWQLDGSTWTESGNERKLDDRKVELVSWTNDDSAARFVTKLNRTFYLNDEASESTRSSDEAMASEAFEVNQASGTRKLRTVRPIGNSNRYFVLTENNLSIFDGTTSSKATRFNQPGQPGIETARELRVFGDRAVYLDDSGFHLVDADLNYVTKLASRQTAVESLSLANGKLAIRYDNNLCQIWNVSGDKPQELGAVEGTSMVKISPDGNWAACRIGDELHTFDVRSEFQQAALKLPLAGGAFDWIGKANEDSKLLLAYNEDAAVRWLEIDADNGRSREREDLPVDFAEPVTEFSLAPNTENFIAVRSKMDDGSTLSVWATNPEGKCTRMTEENEFNLRNWPDVPAFGFSEINEPTTGEIGSHLVVLGRSDASNPFMPRIYLAVKEDVERSDASDEGKQPRFRVQEIEGAIESTDGATQIDLQFSGDGRSLMHVFEKGTRTMLSAE